MENTVNEPAPKYNFVEQEDYLALERSSSVKHEYYRGEVFAMSGASNEHNDIAYNINRVVAPFLHKKECKIYGSDFRVHIPENTLYTYPDFTIVCGKTETSDKYTDNLTNPTVIIEILSPSTKDYDRGSKFMLYRSIKTLNEYITIDSINISVEIYTRQDSNHWLLSEFKQLTDTFVISTIGLTLSLAEVYEDVKIEP
jgi:Uma2 family endonuclease